MTGRSQLTYYIKVPCTKLCAEHAIYQISSMLADGYTNLVNENLDISLCQQSMLVNAHPLINVIQYELQGSKTAGMQVHEVLEEH